MLNNFMNIFITYISSLISLVLIDSVWILFIAKKFYAEHMGFLFSKTINLAPVMVFYPLYAVGIVFLVVLPSQSWVEVLWKGALLGLVSYGAYDLTNHATIPNWPVVMTIVDILWGTFVTAATALIAYFILGIFK